MAAQRSIALKMNNVCKHYPGTLAVDHVDFEVNVGEVHALMGENGAGKSSLMKILAGSFSDYTGTILIQGKKVQLHSPKIAMESGIGMIYQELSLARPISIAENIMAGRLPKKFGFMLDRKQMLDESRKCLKRVGLDVHPDTAIEEISQHEAQLVEIAKALGNHPKILVMDEPTSSLSRKEVAKLFEIIEQLKKEGLTIIYISHHLPEIFKVCDRVTVMRDGKKISTDKVKDVTPEKLVEMMVGKAVDQFYTGHKTTIGDTVLKVNNLSRYGFFHDVSFELKQGEILGIAGLAGAGRSELARAMVGLDPIDAGTVELNGEYLPANTYPNSVREGLVYLSEDRKVDGLFLRLSVQQNIVAAIIPEHSTAGVYSHKHEDDTALEMIDTLEIATPNKLAESSNLSGGNQQKVLLAKWLACKPKVIILDEPSRGVDIGAKKMIHEAVIALANSGASVIVISSDLPEFVNLADRAIVLRGGYIIGEMSKDNMTEESILLAANGESKDMITQSEVSS